MSDDTPTQRFDTPATATPPQKKPNRLVPLLVIVGLVLVAAIVVLVIVLTSRPANPQPAALTSQTPAPTTSAPPPVVNTTPTPTPTPTSSQSHTSAPPPPTQSTDPKFTVFNVQTAINSCSSGPYYTGTPPIVKVTWATIRADSAWIVQGTSDAADSGFMQIPLNGNQSDFQYSIDFSCGTPSSTYTITLVGSNGKHVSKSWTVKNTSPGQ
ncbi:MAG TPA: hypothetical protein VHX87_02500 [Galbitalea sp.]|jgi:hypothetical protein|nr:hypothetical protein [Galbitalea sp.]